MKHDFLYVIWKNPENRRNYIVGKLIKSDGYSFEYSHEYKVLFCTLNDASFFTLKSAVSA